MLKDFEANSGRGFGDNCGSEQIEWIQATVSHIQYRNGCSKIGDGSEHLCSGSSEHIE
jgi:hypothetical protein